VNEIITSACLEITDMLDSRLVTPDTVSDFGSFESNIITTEI